jgi:hypothetical protein
MQTEGAHMEACAFANAQEIRPLAQMDKVRCWTATARRLCD